MTETPLITNDAVLLGVIFTILAVVFHTSMSPRPIFRAFYRWVPSLLLCYLVPALLNTVGVIDGGHSNLYFVASRYFLPACLVLLTLSTDLPGIIRLGPKALVMFATGTLGIVFGGPLAYLLVAAISPATLAGVGPDAVWRGFATVAGSWTGGSANMAALKEVFGASSNLFGMMVAVDILVGNTWLAVLLYLASRAPQIDARMGADTSAIDELRDRMERYAAAHARIPTVRDLMLILAAGLGVTALAHAIAPPLAAWLAGAVPAATPLGLASPFFWIVVTATTAGLLLSQTRARQLEGAGASKLGTVFLYFLIATIGMDMDLTAVWRSPGLFGVGILWLGFHGLLLLVVARWIRAPLFYLAVGSQANVGAAASAPIVASAFHPALAPVGVLLAVLGYAVGTYAGWLCGQLLRLAAGG